MSKIKIYFGLLVLLYIVVALLDSGRTKELDWSPTYGIYDTNPLGLHIFNREIGSFFQSDVQRLEETPYEYFAASYDSIHPIDGNFMYIGHGQELDQQSIEELFYFASAGNTVFLSMTNFPEILKDSLKFETAQDFAMEHTQRLRVLDAKFSNEGYEFKEGIKGTYFSKIDKINTIARADFEADSARINFVEVRYHNGSFLLHAEPSVFANFHMLNPEKRDYSAAILNHIPQGNFHWYAKDSGSLLSQSPLRFVFSQPALKWAWYLFLAGTIAFLVFNAKRKQRAIPVVEKLPNTTIEFARTLGNLIMREGDHKAVIEKKILYFLDRIRTDFLLDTSRLDEEFIKKLAHKSGKDPGEVKKAVQLINTFRQQPEMPSENFLLELNAAFEKIIH